MNPTQYVKSGLLRMLVYVVYRRLPINRNRLNSQHSGELKMNSTRHAPTYIPARLLSSSRKSSHSS